MEMRALARIGGLLLGAALVGFCGLIGTAWADESQATPGLQMTPVPQQETAPGKSPISVLKKPPLLMAEGSNSCEIVSCGMGIKQTCQITCPANQTPKCSCDCVKNFGPMCTEYKANCRCE